jgi:hypothetical protein
LIERLEHVELMTQGEDFNLQGGGSATKGSGKNAQKEDRMALARTAQVSNFRLRPTLPNSL